MINEKRLVAFALFEHARQDWTAIYRAITAAPSLRVGYVRRYRFKSARKLISALYAHDYAPLYHLRSKSRYLKRVGTEALLIFALQEGSSLFVAGSGRFAHLEERRVNDIKWSLRDRYNPRSPDGEMTHNHVIHATDSPAQAHYLARQIGVDSIDARLALHGPGQILPNHLAVTPLRVCKLAIEQLRARWLPDLKPRPIDETPHFLALRSNDEDIYWRYMSPYLGEQLRDGHSWRRFMKLKSDFEQGALLKPIIVAQERDGLYVVRDGVHRASLMRYVAQTACLVAIQDKSAEGLQ